MTRSSSCRLFLVATTLLAASTLSAQVTPAAGFTPPDDTPAIKIGATLFADYTLQSNPNAKDADKNVITPNSFNVGRAYLNVTGNLNHRIQFRITPDIVRETGTGSSIAGSYTFRLKYAFAQFNLDDWSTKGSWVRLGLQQTPYLDYMEGIYRYRFQGPIFADREGFITSSDNGLSGHYNLPTNYGDVHVGFYNGEGYQKAEANDQKAIQMRVAIRPLPLGGVWSGLRAGVFYDGDNYLKNAEKTRFMPFVTFEHKLFNTGFEYLQAKDQTTNTKPGVKADGYSLWITPKLTHGFEVLARHDELKPNKDVDGKKKRDVLGVSYWVPNLQKVTAAVMLDGEQIKYDNIAKPDETRYALHLLVNF